MLGRPPGVWKDPTTQVMVCLQDIEANAEAVRKHPGVADLFPTRGSDWDIRAAVLLSFAGGAGYARGWLTRLHALLAAVPEERRWAAFSDAVTARGTSDDRDFLDNVKTKMAFAGSVAAERLLSGAAPQPAPAPPASAPARAPTPSPSTPSLEASPAFVTFLVNPWILAGERDLNRLTDRAFFAFHPERHGSAIGPHETALAAGWWRLRGQVQAALRAFPIAAPAAPPVPAPSAARPAPASVAPSSVPSAGEVRDVIRASKKVSQRLPGVTLAELVEKHRGDICHEIPLRVLMAFSAVEGDFDDATHGTEHDMQKVGGTYVHAPFTQPEFYELGVFQTPAGLHGVCKDGHAKSCEHGPPGIEKPGDPSSWAKWCHALKLDPNDWNNPTTQVLVGLHDIEHNAVTVRGNRYVAALFGVPGTDWDLRVAVLMAFAGGPGWAVKWLTATQAPLAAVPEPERWPILRAAIVSKGSQFDHTRLANVEKKMALAAKLTDADLLSRTAQELSSGETETAFEEERGKVAYHRDRAVAYARTYAFRPCSDRYMFLSSAKAPRGVHLDDYVKLPADTKIVRQDAADPWSERVLDGDGSVHQLAVSGHAPLDLDNSLLDDCTHFISCCIGQPTLAEDQAGGVALPFHMWGDPKGGRNPYGISRVSTLMAFLLDTELVTAVATKTTDPHEIRRLEPGDIIAYFLVAKGEYEHLALYLGDGKIATHTASRLDEDWQLTSNPYLYTLLHFNT